MLQVPAHNVLPPPSNGCCVSIARYVISTDTIRYYHDSLSPTSYSSAAGYTADTQDYCRSDDNPPDLQSNSSVALPSDFLLVTDSETHSTTGLSKVGLTL